MGDDSNRPVPADVVHEIAQHMTCKGDGVSRYAAHVQLFEMHTSGAMAPATVPFAYGCFTAVRKLGRFRYRKLQLAEDASTAQVDDMADHEVLRVVCRSIFHGTCSMLFQRYATVRIYDNGDPYRPDGTVQVPLYHFECSSADQLFETLKLLHVVRRESVPAPRFLVEPPPTVAVAMATT